MIINQAKEIALNLFLKNNITRPIEEINDIVAYILKCKRLDVYLNINGTFSEEQERLFFRAVKRRANHEPFNYIFNEIFFYDCKLFLSKDVLIPRQETEILVDLVVDYIKKKKINTVWDLCCGSGCIGIALKKKFSNLKVIFSDICEKALAVTKKNCSNNNISRDLYFYKGDLLDAYKGKSDIIICNPPYVTEEEYDSLEKEVHFEPKKALVAKNEGMEFFQKIASQIFHSNFDKLTLFLEIGSEVQGKMIENIFFKYFHKKGFIIKDFNNKGRFFFLEIE